MTFVLRNEFEEKFHVKYNDLPLGLLAVTGSGYGQWHPPLLDDKEKHNNNYR